MSIKLYHCDQHPIPLPPGHKFPTRKYYLLREALEQSGAPFEFRPAPLAELGAVRRVHDSDYVDQFLAGRLEPAAVRRIGFPWSEHLVRRTLASVGGTMSAASSALEDGISGVLAGGTHHAFRAEGSGFCVFNDIAVAIEDVRSRGFASRFAIIDLDVHQGDGTAKLFEEDDCVLTLSVHGRNNFPFRKQRSKIDIDLDDWTEDEPYLEAVASGLAEVRSFRPEMVFYQSGVDGLREDKLGRLGLTHQGLIQRDRLVFLEVRALDVPCVITLGGGYADPIELTVQAHANTYLTAAEIFRKRNEATG
ncbi:MAG TPA: histone deacetylase [Bryobacteraceae bacterium]|nr:histone deacetylase [Bryobacteraceae bacterium]